MFHDQDTITLQIGGPQGPYLVWNGSTTSPGIMLSSTASDQWLVAKAYDTSGLFIGFTFLSVGAKAQNLSQCYLDGLTVTAGVTLNPSNTTTYTGTFWAGIGITTTGPMSGVAGLVCLGNMHGSRLLHGNPTEMTVRLAEESRGRLEDAMWIYNVTNRPVVRSDLNISACSAVYNPGNNVIFSSAQVTVKNSSNGSFPGGWVSADCYLTPSQTDLGQFISIGDFPMPAPSLAAGASANYTLNAQNLFDMSRFLGANPQIASALLGQTCYVFIQVRQQTPGPGTGAGSFSAAFTYNGTT